jgi:hypothetical protein
VGLGVMLAYLCKHHDKRRGRGTGKRAVGVAPLRYAAYHMGSLAGLRQLEQHQHSPAKLGGVEGMSLALA